MRIFIVFVYIVIKVSLTSKIKLLEGLREIILKLQILLSKFLMSDIKCILNFI